MIMCKYFPRLWYDPYTLHVRGLGLFFFSALVCHGDLLTRRLFHGFVKGALPEEYLSHRGYMSAHQQCDLFYPLVGDLFGSDID